ncbi:hypothetical protein [Thioalkalivibrio sp. HK1]|uniref:hypothetical protein n=1 Tax=Thioalkalivibrio sp. HK1 TaxID=1469245 RepID=UPI000471FBDB|nr:hypothetical protein [Thioalkalivibrio sp. HK1]
MGAERKIKRKTEISTPLYFVQKRIEGNTIKRSAQETSSGRIGFEALESGQDLPQSIAKYRTHTMTVLAIASFALDGLGLEGCG